MKFFLNFIFLFLFSFICICQNWQPLAGGVGYYGVRTMYSDSNYLYVAGNFATVDGKHFKGIARWDGNEWDSLSAGVDGLDTVNQWPSGIIATMVEFNNELYVGGAFESIGNIAARGIGRWNGQVWDTIAVQTGGAAELAVINSELYLGGGFDTLAGIAANSIVKWTGNTWQSLGFPNLYPFPYIDAYSDISSICEYDGKIYAAGHFYSSPLDTVGSILSYDGNSWQSVAGGIRGLNGGIGDMIVYHGELYVGGYFFKLDGNAGQNIQKWNGSAWNDVGGGTGFANGGIYKLLVWQDRLYAMGVLESAGGVPADRIAVWDGIRWCGLGNSVDNIILTGAVFHDSLFVGGAFRTIDGDSMNYIAKWTGDESGDTCSTIGISESDLPNQFYFFPNPATASITFLYPVNSEWLNIFDVFGREIRTEELIGEVKTQIDISTLPCGIYIISLLTGNGIVTRKFVKQ